jgi:hypothetical protein
MRGSWARVVIVILLMSLVISPVYAAVELLYFQAIGEPDSIKLIWETATQLDIFGFFVRRSTQEDGDYLRISDPIPIEGDPLTGHSYEFTDSEVDIGVVYYYILEMTTSGQSEFTDPISASTNTSTPTATETKGTTPTVTFTPASNSPTPSRTSTIQPSLTATSTSLPISTSTPQSTSDSTITPTNTLTPDYSPTPSSTTTLMPLPTLTLLFPVFTETHTPVPSKTPVATITKSPTTTGIPAQIENLSPSFRLLITVIIILWVFLGAFILVYFRRLSK